MSLLLNEEFTLYRLRLGYLANSADGIGERLISLNTAVLNEPAFRAAGWLPNPAIIKRCYSPPIPTTGAADYFSRPPVRKRRGNSAANEEIESPEETQGGLISGHRGSEDTLGPSALTEKERRRRKKQQGQHLDEEDSSDLSDDSEDEDTAAQSVRFARMPTRQRRSQPSPERESTVTLKPGDEQGEGGPEVKVISPSYRPRTSSLGATEAINAANAKLAGTRPRRDTTTSSEVSSDGEALSAGQTARFGKKIPSRPQKHALLSQKIAEEEADDSELEDEDEDEVEEDEEEDVEVAEASDLSDEFEGDDVAITSPGLPIQDALQPSDEKRPLVQIPPAITPSQRPSSRRTGSRDDLPKLPKLPPGRPMSTVPPASLLSMALRSPGAGEVTEKPYQKYAELFAKGEAQPIWIKIYAPWSKREDEPLEVPLRRVVNADTGAGPTVNELIGLALWRYDEEGYEPPLKGKDVKLETWELRMVEDGEVDMDFPPLSRNRPVTDFTSNNNRPPQRRMRDKPWDEFGLVRAEGGTAGSDDEAVPVPAAQPTPSVALPAPARQTTEVAKSAALTPSMVPNRNPITGPSFALNATVRKDSSTQLLDMPQAPTTTSTPRMGPAKTVNIHFTDPQSFQTTLLPLETTADTYIAELFDKACTRLGLDKALYVFKVRGTQTVAPHDRTVEALGANLHLDLVRRRFGAVGDFGLGLSGSPGSSLPNAPLELIPNTPPTAKDLKRRKGFGVLHPLTATQPQKTDLMTSSLLDLAGDGTIGRRYNVLRKLPLSFSGAHPRTLIITPEYMQILPGPPLGSSSGGIDDPQPILQGKVTNVPMSSIVGVKVSRKHPKIVRVLVYKEKETKRYDFECASHEEAERIVGDIRLGLGSSGYGPEIGDA